MWGNEKRFLLVFGILNRKRSLSLLGSNTHAQLCNKVVNEPDYIVRKDPIQEDYDQLLSLAIPEAKRDVYSRPQKQKHQNKTSAMEWCTENHRPTHSPHFPLLRKNSWVMIRLVPGEFWPTISALAVSRVKDHNERSDKSSGIGYVLWSVAVWLWGVVLKKPQPPSLLHSFCWKKMTIWTFPKGFWTTAKCSNKQLLGLKDRIWFFLMYYMKMYATLGMLLDW